MYYIYFSFIFVLSILMLVECRMKQQPRWYAAAVFLAPVTFPYFILKIRKEAGIIIMMIFMALFSAVCAGEIILYSIQKHNARFDSMTPFTREMIVLTENIKQSSSKLNNGLIKLEALSKVESRKSQLMETITFITYLRNVIDENQQAIDKMLAYAKNHKDYFQAKNLEWIFGIEHFYNNHNVIQHQKSLEKYLDAFEDLLRYTYTNFELIDVAKDPKYLKNYDEYYIRYRRAVDAHNRFNVKRLEYQNRFLEQYPELTPYLPGKAQPDAFRLWG